MCRVEWSAQYLEQPQPGAHPGHHQPPDLITGPETQPGLGEAQIVDTTQCRLPSDWSRLPSLALGLTDTVTRTARGGYRLKF